MKKLLGVALALTMGVTCTAALAGCDSCGSASEEDKATLAKAMKSIRSLNIEKYDGKETPNDYDIYGEVKVDGENYAVTWELSSADTHINDYIKLGTMNATTKLISVSVTQPETAVEYTMKATIKVGGASDSASFKATIPAKAKEGDGTQANPYSVAQAFALASAMPEKTKLEESDNPTRVCVTGYIVDCGNGNNASRASFVKIADSASTDKADGFTILSINYGDILTSFDDLAVGAKITVSGYLMNYKKDANTAAQPEMTYYGSEGIQCVYLEKVEKTDAEKVALAKAAITLNASYSAGEITLVGSSNGATVTWAVTSGTAVTISGTKMTVNSVDAEATVEITATITSGDEEDTKVFTVKVVKAASSSHAGTEADPYTIADARIVGANLGSGEYYKVDGVEKQIFIKGFVTDAGAAGTAPTAIKNIKIADAAGSSDTINIGGIAWSDALPEGSTLNVGDFIIVRGYLEGFNGALSIYKSTAGDMPIVVSTADNRTPDEKAQAVLDTFTLADGATVTGNVTIPAGVTVSSSNTAVIANNGTVTRPEAGAGDATVILTVSATVDGVTKTKEVTVTVKEKVATVPGQETEVTLDFVANYEVATSGWSSAYASHEVSFADLGASISGKVEFSNADVQDEKQAIHDRPVVAAKSGSQYVTITIEDGSISAVEFDLAQWGSKTFADIHLEYTTDGTTWTSCSSTITTPAKLASTEIPAGVTQVRLVVTDSSGKNTQVGIGSIKLTVA